MRASPYPAIILANTGSPDDLSLKAIQQYLQAFLSDPYVIPNPLTRSFLKRIIIPYYAPQSLKKYQLVHQPEGFPLSAYMGQVRDALRAYFQSRHTPLSIHIGMRYGSPSLENLIKELTYQGQSILLMPFYPQYTQATTGTTIFSALNACPAENYLPRLQYIRDFYNHPRYINALAQAINRHWSLHGKGQQLLFSFHAIPKNWPNRYRQQCEETVRLTAESLQLGSEDYQLVFQSPFGKAQQWLSPQLLPTLTCLATQGIKSVDVICPGFLVDNLETLYDIDLEAAQAFKAAGGTRLSRVPCLNADEYWIKALAHILEEAIGERGPSSFFLNSIGLKP